jgi:hypothetical protein
MSARSFIVRERISFPISLGGKYVRYYIVSAQTQKAAKKLVTRYGKENNLIDGWPHKMTVIRPMLSKRESFSNSGEARSAAQVERRYRNEGHWPMWLLHLSADGKTVIRRGLYIYNCPS